MYSFWEPKGDVGIYLNDSSTLSLRQGLSVSSHYMTSLHLLKLELQASHQDHAAFTRDLGAKLLSSYFHGKHVSHGSISSAQKQTYFEY